MEASYPPYLQTILLFSNFKFLWFFFSFSLTWDYMGAFQNASPTHRHQFVSNSNEFLSPISQQSQYFRFLKFWLFHFNDFFFIFLYMGQYGRKIFKMPYSSHKSWPNLSKFSWSFAPRYPSQNHFFSEILTFSNIVKHIVKHTVLTWESIGKS